MTKYLIGPEIYWGLIYILTMLAIENNTPPYFKFDNELENAWYLVPSLALGTFCIYLWPEVEKNWLFVRIWISGLVMGHFILEAMTEAHSQQNVGIGMIYISGMIILIIALIAGSIGIVMSGKF